MSMLSILFKQALYPKIELKGQAYRDLRDEMLITFIEENSDDILLALEAYEQSRWCIDNGHDEK